MPRFTVPLLAVLCLSSGCWAQSASRRPAPRAVQPRYDQLGGGEQEILPPGRSSGNTVCGDGRRGISGYDTVCASCIPGHPCPCGQIATEEECDGSDLGGQSCESRGFLA